MIMLVKKLVNLKLLLKIIVAQSAFLSLNPLMTRTPIGDTGIQFRPRSVSVKTGKEIHPDTSLFIMDSSNGYY